MSRGPKKSAVTRRTPHASRGPARAGAPAAKMTGARKGAGEGVMPGMTTQPEQSYSERQLYEAALDRLSREIAAVQRVTETEAIKEIEAALAKGPRRGPKPAEEGTPEEGVEEEAA